MKEGINLNQDVSKDEFIPLEDVENEGDWYMDEDEKFINSFKVEGATVVSDDNYEQHRQAEAQKDPEEFFYDPNQPLQEAVPENQEELIASTKEICEKAQEEKEKKSFFKKLKGFFSKDREEQIVRSGGKISYDSFSSVVGAKAIIDWGLYGLHKFGVKSSIKGDVHKYFAENDMERALVEMNNRAIDLRIEKEAKGFKDEEGEKGEQYQYYKESKKQLIDATKDFKAKVDNLNVPESKKKELRKELAMIMAEYKKQEEDIYKGQSEEFNQTMRKYTGAKVGALKLGKDALNSALTFSSFVALRAATYAAFSAVAKGKEGWDQYSRELYQKKKAAAKREGGEETVDWESTHSEVSSEKFKAVLKNVTINAATETCSELVKGRKNWKETEADVLGKQRRQERKEQKEADLEDLKSRLEEEGKGYFGKNFRVAWHKMKNVDPETIKAGLVRLGALGKLSRVFGISMMGVHAYQIDGDMFKSAYDRFSDGLKENLDKVRDHQFINLDKVAGVFDGDKWSEGMAKVKKAAGDLYENIKPGDGLDEVDGYMGDKQTGEHFPIDYPKVENVDVGFDDRIVNLSDEVFGMKEIDFNKWLQTANKEDLGKILDYKEAYFSGPIDKEKVLAIFDKFYDGGEKGLADKIPMNKTDLRLEIRNIRSAFEEAGKELTPDAQARIDELHQAQLELGKKIDAGELKPSVEVSPIKEGILPGVKGEEVSVPKYKNLESLRKDIQSSVIPGDKGSKIVSELKGEEIPHSEFIDRETGELKMENFQIAEGIQAKRGDSIWTMAEKYLEGNDKFKALKGDGKLREALETYNIDRIKDVIVEHPQDYGLPEGVNVDKLTIKQLNSIDWQKAFNDTFQEKSLTEKLSEAQVEGVIKSNQAMEAAAHAKTEIEVNSDVQDLDDFEKVEVPETVVDKNNIHIDNGLVIPREGQFADEWKEWKGRKAIDFINGEYGEAVTSHKPVPEVGKMEWEQDIKPVRADAAEINHRDLLHDRLHNANDLIGAPSEDETIENYMSRYNLANTDANENLYKNLVHEGIVNSNPNLKERIWSRIDKMPSALKSAVASDFELNKGVLKGYLNIFSGNKDSAAEGIRQMFNVAKVNPDDIELRSDGSVIYNNAFGRKGYDLVLSNDKIGVDGPLLHNWNVSGSVGKTPEGKLSLDTIREGKKFIIEGKGKTIEEMSAELAAEESAKIMGREGAPKISETVKDSPGSIVEDKVEKVTPNVKSEVKELERVEVPKAETSENDGIIDLSTLPEEEGIIDLSDKKPVVDNSVSTEQEIVESMSVEDKELYNKLLPEYRKVGSEKLLSELEALKKSDVDNKDVIVRVIRQAMKENEEATERELMGDDF